MERIITADSLSGQNGLVIALFRALYPDGLTLEEAKRRSGSRGWLRRILESLEEAD